MIKQIDPRGVEGVLYRKHGKKNNVKIDSYDDKYVKIKDTDGLHFIPKAHFNTENFMELKNAV